MPARIRGIRLPMTAEQRHPGRRYALSLPALPVLLVAAGLVLAVPATGRPAAEDGVNRMLAAHRGPLADSVSSWFSGLAATSSVVTVTALCVLALLLAPKRPRWWDAAFLGGAVAVQALVFLLVTICVERPRPDVVRLDGAPPTSSFPSGHTGAALALYGGLAVLAYLRLRRPWRVPVAAALLLLPVLVGLSRLYRGMHHPTDVVAALLNGSVVLVVAARFCLVGREPARAAAPGVAGTGTARAGDDGPAAVAGAEEQRPGAPGGTVVVVVNPLVTDRATREIVRQALERSGYPDPVFTETTADDSGGRATARAVRDGATLVVACGGDGTVTACAGALSDTSVPLLVAPCGTGNLLARNLGLPKDVGRALEEGLAAEPWAADLVLARGDGMPDTYVTAMAGAGLDADIMAGADRRLKNLIGWPAYGVAALRHLRAPRLRLTVVPDDAAPLQRRARMVVAGNVGAIQGGLRLLPAARLDDGLLDLVLFDPRGPVDWLRALRLLALGAAGSTTGPAGLPRRPLEYLQARSAELTFDRPVRRELDGEPVTAGRTLRLETHPGALLLRAPRPRHPGGGSGPARRREVAPAGPARAVEPLGERSH